MEPGHSNLIEEIGALRQTILPLLNNQVHGEAFAMLLSLNMKEKEQFGKSNMATLQMLAVCSYHLGDLHNAYTYAQQSIAQLTSDHPDTDTGTERLLLATIYGKLGRIQEAREQYQKCIETFKSNNKLLSLKNAYNNFADLEHQNGRFDEARNLFESALAVAQQMGSIAEIAQIQGNLGTYYTHRGLLEQATAHFEVAIPSLRKENLPQTLGNVLLGRFNLLRKSGRRDEAEADLLESIQLLTAATKNSSLLEAYGDAYTFYKEQQNYEQALHYHEKMMTLERDIDQAQALQKITALEHQHELKAQRLALDATEKILLNILPSSIVHRMRQGEQVLLDRYPNCSVLFADIVAFTDWSRQFSAPELAFQLNRIFELFDDLSSNHGAEKIKTIGDAYMCATGLPEPQTDHAQRMALLALSMEREIALMFPDNSIRLRIGIHCGEVIAGVLGKNKYAYDLWGDTVNTASRMESTCPEQAIQVSNDFMQLAGSQFTFQLRGTIAVKGKGEMTTWLLKKDA
ncbi:MAG: adenylate/guanylate cyclase domain-containing protein [Chitinophagales bacterium]